MQLLTEPKLENVTLYYREGGSDKVYQCAIEQAGERFVVNFAYGRRGSTLNTGTKTNVPVDYEDAKRIFDKLVREKTAKGYTPGKDGTPYQHTEKQPSGILPQLLNSIEESQVINLMEDDAWCGQEKFDGRRLMVCRTGSEVSGINPSDRQRPWESVFHTSQPHQPADLISPIQANPSSGGIRCGRSRAIVWTLRSGDGGGFTSRFSQLSSQ